MQQIEADRYVVRIQPERLSVEGAYRAVADGNVGAVSLFVGTTRQFTEGRGETIQLEYDCYPPMALDEMARLCAAVLAATDLQRLFIAHRTGVVPLGEASVVIAASAPHRHEALEACRSLIDTLKETVPIWKKEVYTDGRTEWVQGSSERPEA